MLRLGLYEQALSDAENYIKIPSSYKENMKEAYDCKISALLGMMYL